MKILSINSDGAGIADQIEVTTGTAVSQRLPSGNASDYLIRVNRQPSSADQVFQE